MPDRLAPALAPEGVIGERRDRELETLAAELKCWHVTPTGTKGCAKAEVTVGGIDTAEHSSKTMEAKKVPGLYAIGEAVDVTGWLGASSCMVTGANASESRRPRVGNQARSVRGKVGSVGVVRAKHSLRTSAAQFPAFAPCQTAPR
jgi:hypothetical protein